jgi:hypothetical protein
MMNEQTIGLEQVQSLNLSGGLRLIQGGRFDTMRIIGEHYRSIDWDLREDSLKILDLSKLRLVSCLDPGESRITGEEHLHRLVRHRPNFIRLGGRSFYSLWTEESHRTLNLLREQGIEYLDFPGLITGYPTGCRRIPYFYLRENREWWWGVYRLSLDWGINARSACLNEI